MPQFDFIAEAPGGGAQAGRVEAVDIAGAAIAVRALGLEPTQLIAAPQLGEPSAAATGKVDLTRPLSSAADQSQTRRMEPWERGGPVPQTGPPVAQQVTRPTQIPEATEARATPETVTPDLSDGDGGSLPERMVRSLLFPIYSGVVLRDLVPFYRQFAALINAGIPLYQCLVGLEQNTTNARLKKVAHEAQRQVQDGGRLSAVLARHPWIFPPLHTELIRASEMSGTLDDTLKDIATYVERELDLRRSLSRSTLYPKIVLFVALMILGYPGFTGDTMAIVKLVVADKFNYTGGLYLRDTIGFGLLLTLPIAAAVAVFRVSLFNVPGVREGYDRFKMSLPGLGKLVRMFATAKFLRTYAAMYRAGIGMGTCLDVAGAATGNAVVRSAATRAARAADAGRPVAESLRMEGLLPGMATDMISTGESAGSLDAMMDSAAYYFEEEGAVKAHQWAMITAVVFFLLVAILIGFEVISFYVGGASSVMHSTGEGG